MEDIKVGDLVRKQGDNALFKVIGLYEDGFLHVVQVTSEHDKRAYFRHYTEFELAKDV